MKKKSSLADRDFVFIREFPREYNIFAGMKKRCNNPKAKGYKDYGGRGIQVYWDTFDEFMRYIGPCPTPKHTIDRIDSDKDYAPGNVKWSTWHEQSRNCSRNVRVEYQGVSYIAKDFADKFSLCYDQVRELAKAGVSAEEIISRKRKFKRWVFRKK